MIGILKYLFNMVTVDDLNDFKGMFGTWRYPRQRLKCSQGLDTVTLQQIVVEFMILNDLHTTA
jgi:hypothetical protein